jgi:hypothetical protein
MLGKWNSFNTYRYNKNEENTMYHTFMDGKINQFYDLILNGISYNSFVFCMIVSLVISFIRRSWDDPTKNAIKIPRTKTNFMQISALILILKFLIFFKKFSTKLQFKNSPHVLFRITSRFYKVCIKNLPRMMKD